ncbi:MAG: N-acetylglucosamine kinase [Betaproteobacteria bacterium]
MTNDPCQSISMGVDSGGTKTVGCVISSDGAVLGLGHGGPTNTLFVPERDARHAVREAILGALGRRGMVGTVCEEVFPQVRVVYLLAPGFPADSAERSLRPIVPEAKIVVESDAYAAFRGALPQGDGVVVLSGTGSFACGRWRGRWVTTGGWGPLVGDEGSRYWIGVEALKAVVRAVDGRGPATQLRDIFRRTLHYSFDRELHHFIYSNELNRQRIAGLTLLVTQAAKDGDQVARDILERAGKELAILGCSVVARLGAEKGHCAISATGGVMRPGSVVLEAFRSEVERMMPRARYVPARFRPWVSAALRALKLDGVKITDAHLTRLGQSIICPVELQSATPVKQGTMS